MPVGLDAVGDLVLKLQFTHCLEANEGQRRSFPPFAVANGEGR